MWESVLTKTCDDASHHGETAIPASRALWRNVHLSSRAYPESAVTCAWSAASAQFSLQMENLRARSRYVGLQRGANFCERRHARAQVCRCVGVRACERVGVCVCVRVCACPCACACEGIPVARGKEMFPVQLQRREEPAAAAGRARGAQQLAGPPRLQTRSLRPSRRTEPTAGRPCPAARRCGGSCACPRATSRSGSAASATWQHAVRARGSARARAPRVIPTAAQKVADGAHVCARVAQSEPAASRTSSAALPSGPPPSCSCVRTQNIQSLIYKSCKNAERLNWRPEGFVHECGGRGSSGARRTDSSQPRVAAVRGRC
jgi:hypothetical protein